MSRPFKDVFYENYRSTHTADRYADTSVEEFRRKLYPKWNTYFKPHLPADKNASILDVGCGDGAFVDYLHNLGYATAVGIDLSEEQIQHGLKLGFTNISVADLTDFLANSQASYDVIIARDVLEHFTHQGAFEMVASVSRALSPNGKLIIQVPNGQGIFYTSIYWGDFTHELAFTDSSVRQLFKNAGLSSTRCYPTGPVPYSLTSWIRAVLWKYKVAQTRFWKLVETGSPQGIFTNNLIAVGEKGEGSDHSR